MGANVAVCLTGAAELGVDMAGPSLSVCPRVATMVVLFSVWFQVTPKSLSAQCRSHYGVNTGRAYTPQISVSLLCYLSDVLLVLNTLQITGTH